LLGPDVVLDLLLDPGTAPVLVDPGQMEQVLVNLIMNAREAMPQGGRASITTWNVEQDPPYVAIAVKDTGIGMDATTRSRIFEPFFTTKHGSSGTGLGLSTVLGIVEQSGGYIDVESELGQGAAFTMCLPAYSGSEAALTTIKRPVAQGGSETLLLVEDEPAIRASVGRLLEWHGYRVLEAENGREALRVYDESFETIDLVLTDLVMPEMGGHELIQLLRARNPEIRVVVMSGYAEQSVANDGALPSGVWFIEKPFTVDALMRQIRSVLDA
jgi:two-component system, cell cycle sensor histidine kinase and response regulator CckA